MLVLPKNKPSAPDEKDCWYSKKYIYILIYSQFADNLNKEWHNDDGDDEEEEEVENGDNYIQWIFTLHLTEHAIT